MIVSTPSFAAEPPRMMDYKSIVTFGTSDWVLFKDFSIRYAGTREVPNPHFKAPMTFHQFDVKSNTGDMQRIEWTSGMGEIQPTPFTVGDSTFFLELRYTIIPSETARKGQPLADNQVFILTQEEHDTLMNNLVNQLNAK